MHMRKLAIATLNEIERKVGTGDGPLTWNDLPRDLYYETARSWQAFNAGRYDDAAAIAKPVLDTVRAEYARRAK